MPTIRLTVLLQDCGIATKSDMGKSVAVVAGGGTAAEDTEDLAICREELVLEKLELLPCHQMRRRSVCLSRKRKPPSRRRRQLNQLSRQSGCQNSQLLGRSHHTKLN